jgi:hypothetical protein
MYYGISSRVVGGFSGASSNSILIGADASSSNCPVLTLQMNAPRNKAATLILANSKRIMTLIDYNCLSKLFSNEWQAYDKTQWVK